MLSGYSCTHGFSSQMAKASHDILSDQGEAWNVLEMMNRDIFRVGDDMVF